MEDDEESDDIVEALREGLVVVKFSREFKQNIRNPWARALIVKVYGRRALGDHFLCIQPWEPDFKPELVNVSSIAVWIRLNGLPIEYYNAEALYLIGKAIGNVLRVDTHTALEARGRFARLCIQVDVTKPLVTAIMIGKLEQPVCYEGIQKLCFDCGRMGHKWENFSYLIRQDMPSKETVGIESEKKSTRSCYSRGVNADKVGEGLLGSCLITYRETLRRTYMIVHMVRGSW
ncbi:hypothetical protein SO802_011771 [Lithocarpus litseifolius]|uniref:DUF4283 domain-containing protein n=1 Tax=Lithocarpus litseifolius TaxID=425828 RepID=A0AAW2D516_9ROSI